MTISNSRRHRCRRSTRIWRTVVLLPLFVSVGTGQSGSSAVAHNWKTALALQNTGAATSEKSPLLAVGLSLLLPGMGELYSGNSGSARYFLAADGALWLTYAGFVLHSDWIRADARLFATERSGAEFSGKDEQYGVNVGNYTSMDEYNQAKLRNREFESLYYESRYTWNWTTESDRLRYRDLRIKSDEVSQSAKFVIGALVINRVISAFSAWRSAISSNRDRAQGWYLTAEVQGGILAAHGLGLKIRTRL